MAKELTPEDIENALNVLSLLRKTKDFEESTGVSSKGVIKDGESTNNNNTLAREISNIVKDRGKVSGSLTSAEESRYTAIFKILKKVLMPGPEADTLKGIKGAEAVNADKTQANARNKKKVAAGLGAAAAAAAAAALAGENGKSSLLDRVKDGLESVMKGLGQVGKFLVGAAGYLGLRKLFDRVFGGGRGQGRGTGRDGGQGRGQGANRTKPFRDKQGRLRGPDGRFLKESTQEVGSKLKKSKLLKALKLVGKGGLVGFGLSVLLDQFFPDWETELGEMLGEKAVLGFIKAKSGQVDKEKERIRKAKYQKTIDQFDRDGDGMLNESERIGMRRFYEDKRAREQLRKQIEEAESKSAGGGETYYLGDGQLDSLGATPSEVQIKGSNVVPAAPSANVTSKAPNAAIQHIGEKKGGKVNEASKVKVIDTEAPVDLNPEAYQENIQLNIPDGSLIEMPPKEPIRIPVDRTEYDTKDSQALNQINTDQLTTLNMIQDGIQKLVALQGGRTKPPISLTTETISESLTPNTYAPVGSMA